jgi:hypothetical protein
MEVLLQVWDELDDLVGCIRHMWLGVRVDLTASLPRPKLTTIERPRLARTA